MPNEPNKRIERRFFKTAVFRFSGGLIKCALFTGHGGVRRALPCYIIIIFLVSMKGRYGNITARFSQLTARKDYIFIVVP